MEDDIEGLKRKRAKLLERARDLVDRGNGSDAEIRQCEDLLAQADELEEQIGETEFTSYRGTARSQIEARTGRYASKGPKTRAGGTHVDNKYENFSLVKAIRAMVTNDWRGAELEREAGDEAAQLAGRESRGGILVPDGAWFPSRAERRDLLKGTDSAGGYSVAEDLLGGSFIDRLVNRSVMLQAGVTVLNDLRGDVAIARLASGATGYWVAENAAPTESAQTFEQITLAPKSVAGYVDVSRRLLLQSSIDVENMVRNDLVLTLATAIDLAILLGTGASNQPAGVRNITGVTDKSGTNGEAISWTEILDLESGVATANADIGRLAYITNSTIRGSMKSTLKVSGGTAPPFIWEGAPRPVNDYPCFVTNQIPNDLTKGSGSALSYVFFGNWGDVLLGRWSGLDVLIDPFTGGAAGTVRIIVFADVDVAVRHPESFVYGYYS